MAVVEGFHEPEFVERGECGLLFGLFLGGRPAAGESAAIDFDADVEGLGVVWALVVEHDVGGLGEQFALGVLLEDGLEVLLVA